MAYLLGIDTCPKCGDRMSSPVRSGRATNVYNQTCRNGDCLHFCQTVVTVAPEPARPRPAALPLPVEGPRPPATKSAIAAFELAYERGQSRDAIKRSRRQARAVSRADGKAKQLGRNA